MSLPLRSMVSCGTLNLRSHRNLVVWLAWAPVEAVRRTPWPA